MTIKELINELQKIEQQFEDLPVVGSCDEEQNCLGDVFQVQCGTLTEFDQYTNNTIKVGDRMVVIVPAM